MGCATSKPKVCQNCHAPYSPVVSRKNSSHVQRPSQKDNHGYHLVALTSSTLGSLRLDPLYQSLNIKDDNNVVVKSSDDEFGMGLIEPKTWSQMIDEKIPKQLVPKTPIRTPPGEPETINAWELMEGLEDISPLKPAHLVAHSSSITSTYDPEPMLKENENSDESEMADNESNSNSNDTSIVSEFDRELITTFMKSLEELPPTNPFYLKPLMSEMEVTGLSKLNGEVTNDKLFPRVTEKLIVYFTSLRGVRKTYEDCSDVRVILKGLGVKIDERDVSMHSKFKEELKELSGEGLPRVYLGKKYIGGADDIRILNEDGQLETVLEGCEWEKDGVNIVCEACGDIRFVPCETCSGSCKIYYEPDYDESEYEEEEYGFQRCTDCNENGLIRCPICCD